MTEAHSKNTLLNSIIDAPLPLISKDLCKKNEETS